MGGDKYAMSWKEEKEGQEIMSPSWKGGVVNTQEQYERVLYLEAELKKLKVENALLKADLEKMKADVDVLKEK